MPKRILSMVHSPNAAAELVAIRQHLGLTQRQFACMLGATARSLSRWELGQRPVPATVLTLARFYALWTQPLCRFLPDPATLTLRVEASITCNWAAAGPCHGARVTLRAQISRRRQVIAEVCQAHVWMACQAIDHMHTNKRLPLRRLGRVEAVG
jgi:transcriptional regulator with XRE-family HTH domain